MTKRMNGGKPLINLHMQKKLTKAMNREIETRGDNIFEEAYHGRIEATDWKDCYD